MDMVVLCIIYVLFSPWLSFCLKVKLITNRGYIPFAYLQKLIFTFLSHRYTRLFYIFLHHTIL